MILSEIIKIIEAEYPKNLAYEWDNVGLLAGRADMDIKTVLVTLDITPDVVKEAKECGAELILSHHPLIFDGIKNFCENNSKTNMYIDIIRNKIAVYSAHTNMDTAPNGINQKLSELFSIKNTMPLDPETGLGRVGDIEPKPCGDFIKEVSEKLSTPIRFSGDREKIIKRAAVGSGACADLIPNAIAGGADVFITADVKYHNAIDAVSDGLSIIDAGHYPTEIIVMDMFWELLKNTDLKIVKSKNKDIFSFIL